MTTQATDDFFTVRVGRLAAGGAGVARISGGLAVFVNYTAPGDLARIRIKTLHKNWAEAELIAIEEPSPCRVAPPCPLYGRCGGCSLQHISYETQLAEKKTVLKDAFAHIGGFGALPEITTVPSPPYAYRNRVRLRRDPASGKPAFKGRWSGELVPVDDCPVACEGIRRFLQDDPHDTPDAASFTLYARGDVFLCDVPDPRYRRRGSVPILGRELALDAGAFFQSNAVMLERLIPALPAAAEKAGPHLPAADFYCGVGTFAAFLRDRFQRVDLFEADRAALTLARINVSDPARNQADNDGGRFFAGTDSLWARDFLRGKAGAYGFAALDPPRAGLSRPFRDCLAAKGPPVLAYVSCDPASLARDCRTLCGGGYRIESLAFYDFYPQTPHIESLTILTRE
jgi:23S rRNA (uracil1939-C5)-methyltransferase